MFFIGWWESGEEWYWHSNLFHSYVQHENIEHLLKSKLAWLVCAKSAKSQWKWCGSNDHRSFYLVITWKLLFNGGMNLRFGDIEIVKFFTIAKMQVTFTFSSILIRPSSFACFHDAKLIRRLTWFGYIYVWIEFLI